MTTRLPDGALTPDEIELMYQYMGRVVLRLQFEQTTADLLSSPRGGGGVPQGKFSLQAVT